GWLSVVRRSAVLLPVAATSPRAPAADQVADLVQGVSAGSVVADTRARVRRPRVWASASVTRRAGSLGRSPARKKVARKKSPRSAGLTGREAPRHRFRSGRRQGVRTSTA